MKQIRQEHSFVSFSKHVRSLGIPVNAFWKQNEKRLFGVSHLASAEAVNFECTLLNKTASTEETSHWKLCQLIDAGPLAERRR